jgi:hypothetical protein
MYQCCQMVYFQTKNLNLGNIWKVYISMEAFGIFMAILSILRPFCLLYGHLVHMWSFGTYVVIWYICGHLVHMWSFGTYVVIWYIFSRFGMLYRVKSTLLCTNLWSPCSIVTPNLFLGHWPHTYTYRCYNFWVQWQFVEQLFIE